MQAGKKQAAQLEEDMQEIMSEIKKTRAALARSSEDTQGISSSDSEEAHSEEGPVEVQVAEQEVEPLGEARCNDTLDMLSVHSEWEREEQPVEPD